MFCLTLSHCKILRQTYSSSLKKWRYIMYKKCTTQMYLSKEEYPTVINNAAQFLRLQVKKRLPWIFLFVWVFPMVVHIPYPFTIELLHGTCFLLYHVRTVQHRVLLLLSRWLFLSIIPSVLIVVLYTRMGLAMKFDFKGMHPLKIWKLLTKQHDQKHTTLVNTFEIFLFHWFSIMFYIKLL